MDALKLCGLDSEWDEEFYLACVVEPDGRVATYRDRPSVVARLRGAEAHGFAVAAHNGRADYKTLGYYPEGLTRYDSLVLSWLVNENGQHGLKPLSEVVLARPLEDPIKMKDGHPYWRNYKTRLKDAPVDEVAHYCAEDARATRDLAIEFWSQLPENLRNWYLQWEQDNDSALYGLETRGIRIDTERLADETYALSADCQDRMQKVFAEVGYEFNINSTKQLGSVLFSKKWFVPEREVVGKYKNGKDKLGWVDKPRTGLALSAVKTTKGGAKATDEESLARLAGHPVVDALLEYREASKVLGTYLQAFPRFMRGDRLYGHFNSTGTVTGRLSSSDPNLQNIPARGELGKRVRSLFIPAEGHSLVVGDLDQVELRLLAGMAKEPNLLRAFAEGRDVHQETADLVGVDRALAKNVNYSLAYGAEARTIQQKYARNQPLEFIQGVLETHQRTFPNIYEWKERVLSFCYRNGYVVTIGGRKRNLPDIWSRDWKRNAAAERQAINSVIQGSAADLMKLILVNMHRAKVPMLLQVHDELVCEVPTGEEEWVFQEFGFAIANATRDLGIRVPITCEPKIVSTWAEAK